jgi:hypothetical protein
MCMDFKNFLAAHFSFTSSEFVENEGKSENPLAKEARV